MADAGGDGTLRQLEPHWNRGMIAASIAISLLGAFTSTQLYVSCYVCEYDVWANIGVF
jgi:hypothetical protein